MEWNRQPWGGNDSACPRKTKIERAHRVGYAFISDDDDDDDDAVHDGRDDDDDNDDHQNPIGTLPPHTIGLRSATEKSLCIC